MAAVAAKPAKVPPGFARRQIKVNGADVVLFEGGSGEPLLFLHGAGTVSGFNFSASWARKFKVYLPYHPGFGESADSAAITSIDDYVLHYLELLDHLELDKVRLVGLSMGGWIAATLLAAGLGAALPCSSRRPGFACRSIRLRTSSGSGRTNCRDTSYKTSAFSHPTYPIRMVPIFLSFS